MNNRSYSGIFYYFSLKIILSFLLLTLAHNAIAAEGSFVFSKKLEDASAGPAVKFKLKNSNKTKNLDGSETVCHEFTAAFSDLSAFFAAVEKLIKEGAFASHEISSVESAKDEKSRVHNCKIFITKSLQEKSNAESARRSRMYEHRFRLLIEMIGGAKSFGVSITRFYYLPDLKIEAAGYCSKLDGVLAYAYSLSDCGAIRSFGEFSAKTVHNRESGSYYHTFRISAVMK